MESAVTVRGQVTIPEAIREDLGLKPGDRVKFFVHSDGSVALLQKVPVTALRGVWRQSLIDKRKPSSALHACGNSSHQGRQAEVAIRARVERLWQVDLEETN